MRERRKVKSFPFVFVLCGADRGLAVGTRDVRASGGVGGDFCAGAAAIVHTDLHRSVACVRGVQ